MDHFHTDVGFHRFTAAQVAQILQGSMWLKQSWAEIDSEVQIWLIFWRATFSEAYDIWNVFSHTGYGKKTSFSALIISVELSRNICIRCQIADTATMAPVGVAEICCFSSVSAETGTSFNWRLHVCNVTSDEQSDRKGIRPVKVLPQQFLRIGPSLKIKLLKQAMQSQIVNF